MFRLVKHSVCLVLAFSVSACGGDDRAEDADGQVNFAKLVGTTKNPPDEFAVIPSAPLQLPGNFAALPEPNPGQRSPLLPDARSEARSILFGEAAPEAANARLSPSEAALVSATGAASSGNIRQQLDADQAKLEDEQSLYVLDNIFPALRQARGVDRGQLILPEEERVRLSQRPSGAQANDAGIAVIAAPEPAAVPQAPAPDGSVTGDGNLIYIPE